ncbi:MAG: hypothetical protein EOO88_54765 [Pedobacter sp.]|nr:MAG: hypothetical protein EOO88_54765 [Pedobacter sp.]
MIETIAALVSIIALIVFFVMSSNISSIKHEMRHLNEENRKAVRREHNLNYHMNRVLGNKEEAIKNLTFVLMFDLTTKQLNAKELRAEYEDFKVKNEQKFIEMGSTFPEYPFSK